MRTVLTINIDDGYGETSDVITVTDDLGVYEVAERPANAAKNFRGKVWTFGAIDSAVSFALVQSGFGPLASHEINSGFGNSQDFSGRDRFRNIHPFKAPGE